MAVSAASLSWEELAEAIEFHYDRERNNNDLTETFHREEIIDKDDRRIYHEDCVSRDD